jgi:hypothetical protein
MSTNEFEQWMQQQVDSGIAPDEIHIWQAATAACEKRMTASLLPSEDKVIHRYMIVRSENDPYANGVWSCYDWLREQVAKRLNGEGNL